MPNPAEDLWREWRSWITRSGEQQLGAWRAYADTTSGLLKSRATPVDAGRAYVKVARDEGVRYVRELTTLGVCATPRVSPSSTGESPTVSPMSCRPPLARTSRRHRDG